MIHNCSNCKHFVRHYIQFNAHMQRLHIGHCFFQRKKQMRDDAICDHWESNAEQSAKTNRCIYYTINAIEKELRDIKYILYDKKTFFNDDNLQ